MDSLGFLVSYDTSIFTLALKLSLQQPENRKLRYCVKEISGVKKNLRLRILLNFTALEITQTDKPLIQIVGV